MSFNVFFVTSAENQQTYPTLPAGRIHTCSSYSSIIPYLCAMRKYLPLLIIVLSLASCKMGAQQQQPQEEPQPSSDTVSVFMIGDVMMHSVQLKYDCKHFFKYIQHKMKDADVGIANMEFSLGGEPYTGYPMFSAPDRIAHYMAEIGTDVFLTANNHILDRRSKGLVRTLDVYRSMKDSVLFTGSFGSEQEKEDIYPLIVESKGIKLALVNFTYGTNGLFVEGCPNTNYMDSTEIKAAIDRAKAKNADFIVALPHWGEEYHFKHSKNQEKWARWLIDQGCDAIIGTHPHVVQDTTFINNKPVIYSLGNSVSNMTQRERMLEMAVTMRFVKCGEEKQILTPELHYMWNARPGKLENNFCTIFIDEWKGRRDEWILKSDYDDMVAMREKYGY